MVDTAQLACYKRHKITRQNLFWPVSFFSPLYAIVTQMGLFLLDIRTTVFNETLATIIIIKTLMSN